MGPPWLYDEFIQPTQYFGFVYLITNLTTGRKYVGRKQVFNKKKRNKYVECWETYWGSCKPLTADIERIGLAHFQREILRWCDSEETLAAAEFEEQVARDVLNAVLPSGERAFYNGNIMARTFVKQEVSIETRLKQSKVRAGRRKSPSQREKLSIACRGERHPRSRLDDDSVRRIIQYHQAGLRQHEIAGKFGVSRSTIGEILIGKKWAHVTGIKFIKKSQKHI